MFKLQHAKRNQWEYVNVVLWLITLVKKTVWVYTCNQLRRPNTSLSIPETGLRHTWRTWQAWIVCRRVRLESCPLKWNQWVPIVSLSVMLAPIKKPCDVARNRSHKLYWMPRRNYRDAAARSAPIAFLTPSVVDNRAWQVADRKSVV